LNVAKMLCPKCPNQWENQWKSNEKRLSQNLMNIWLRRKKVKHTQKIAAQSVLIKGEK
jgi:hypothetical protein